MATAPITIPITVFFELARAMEAEAEGVRVSTSSYYSDGSQETRSTWERAAEKAWEAFFKAAGPRACPECSRWAIQGVTPNCNTCSGTGCVETP